MKIRLKIKRRRRDVSAHKSNKKETYKPWVEAFLGENQEKTVAADNIQVEEATKVIGKQKEITPNTTMSIQILNNQESQGIQQKDNIIENTGTSSNIEPQDSQQHSG